MFNTAWWVGLTLVVNYVRSAQIKTGEGQLFYKPGQQVNAGYIQLAEDNSVYYQYFQSLNVTNRRNIVFYFGNYVGGSAVRDAAYGVIPYLIMEDPSKPGNVKLLYNPWSLNEYANVVVADIVRGSGFSQSNASRTLTFQQIAADISSFVDKFFEAHQSPSENDHRYVMGGYQLTMPILSFLNSTTQNFSALLTNIWLGYPTIDQTHILLPAYGITDRLILDRISNQLYSMQVNDYSKDIDEMYADLLSILSVLNNKTFIDFNNPMVSQSQVAMISTGIKLFYGSCTSCKVYVNVYKTADDINEAVMSSLKKDLVKDYRQSIFETAVYLAKSRKSGKSTKDFLLFENGHTVKANVLTLEDATPKNFQPDSNPLFTLPQLKRYYMELDETTKLYYEECLKCGFYSLLESNLAAYPLISVFNFIFEPKDAKMVDSEYNYKNNLTLWTANEMKKLGRI